MGPISYLLVLTEKPGHPNEPSIDVEIIGDVWQIPLHNLYSFKRSLPKVESVNGEIGRVTKSSLSSNTELLEELRGTLESARQRISPECERILEVEIAKLHEQVLASIADIEQLLNFVGTHHYHPSEPKSGRILVQIASEIKKDAGKLYISCRYFNSNNEKNWRRISGGKALSILGDLADLGRHLFVSDAKLVEIETRIIKSRIIGHPDATLIRALGLRPQIFRRYPDLLADCLSIPRDAESEALILTQAATADLKLVGATDKNTSELVAGLLARSAHAISASDDAKRINLTLTALVAATALTGNDAIELRTIEIIKSQLSLSRSPDVKAACLEKLVDSQPNWRAQTELVQLAATELVDVADLARLLKPRTCLELAVAYYHSLGRESLFGCSFNSQFNDSSEMAEMVRAIGSRKKGRAADPLPIITRLFKAGRSNHALALLNELYSSGQCEKLAELAELYLLCLPNATASQAIKLARNIDSLVTRPNAATRIADHLLANQQFDECESFLSHISNIEPGFNLLPILSNRLRRSVAIHQLKDKELSRSDLSELDGVDFELLLSERFRALGFQVESTPITGDYGADIIVEDTNGTRFVIQCKRFASKVNLKAVQEVTAAVKHYSADYGIVATNNEFLPSAKELAKTNHIELWDGTLTLMFLSGDLSFSVLGQ